MESSWWRTDKNSLKENKNSQKLSFIESFDDMNLKDNLLRGIYSYGFENPSKIQSQVIGPMIERRDILAQSQSGTGKTAAFVIGMLNQINFYESSCQALIICPTR